jgi:hypothetical protein
MEPLPPRLSPPPHLRRTWLALSEPADPAFALPVLRREYHELLARAAAAAPPPPELAATFDLIERDVARTFGGVSGAFDTQASRDALRRLLAAYALRDPEVGYVQSMNVLGGFVLLVFRGAHDDPASDEADAYALFVRLMSAPGYDMRRFYTPDMAGVGVMSHVISRTLQRHAPAVAAHLEAVRVDPVFIVEYYLTLFCYVLPPDMAAEVWTIFLADGWCAVLRVIVVLLQEAAPHMLGGGGGSNDGPADFTSTVAVLKGYQNDRIRCDFPGALP